MTNCNVKWVNGHTNKRDMQGMLHINTKRIWDMVVRMKAWGT